MLIFTVGVSQKRGGKCELSTAPPAYLQVPLHTIEVQSLLHFPFLGQLFGVINSFDDLIKTKTKNSQPPRKNIHVSTHPLNLHEISCLLNHLKLTHIPHFRADPSFSEETCEQASILQKHMPGPEVEKA